MPTTTRAAPPIAAILIAVGACSTEPPSRTCGTIAGPGEAPVSVPDHRCNNNETGVTWYTAVSAADVSEPDEQPVNGQPLDGDWWDPIERSDPDDLAEQTLPTAPPSRAACPATTRPTARPTSRAAAPTSAPPTRRPTESRCR